MARCVVVVGVTLAGVFLQCISSNPMASPELLGVSGGTMLGVIGVALFAAAPTTAQLLSASGLGTFALMLALRFKRGFAPGCLLLVSVVAISGFSQSVITLMAAPWAVAGYAAASLRAGSICCRSAGR